MRVEEGDPKSKRFLISSDKGQLKWQEGLDRKVLNSWSSRRGAFLVEERVCENWARH